MDERVKALVDCLNDGKNPAPLLTDLKGDEAARLILIAILDRRCRMTPNVVLELLNLK